MTRLLQASVLQVFIIHSLRLLRPLCFTAGEERERVRMERMGSRGKWRWMESDKGDGKERVRTMKRRDGCKEDMVRMEKRGEIDEEW